MENSGGQTRMAVAWEIPRPEGENAGLWDDAKRVRSPSVQTSQASW